MPLILEDGRYNEEGEEGGDEAEGRHVRKAKPSGSAADRRPAGLCQLLDATSAGKGRRLAFDPPHGLRIEHSFAARRALEKAELRNRIPATPELTRPAPPDLSNSPATTGRTGLNPQAL